MERRTAVIDLGSNTFRLVVFEGSPDAWWRTTDELPDRVRIGEGAEAAGRLGDEPTARALAALRMYRRYVEATGLDDVRAVATSAIRDAANGEDFLAQATDTLGRPIEVLAADEEARYGVTAAIHSTSLEDGAVLDLGGGSLQLSCVQSRTLREAGSWPLGAVRMTERFLPGGEPDKSGAKALRKHVAKQLGGVDWLPDAGRLVAMGGTVRNLAAAALHRAGRPLAGGIQGAEVSREELSDLVGVLGRATPEERARIAGINERRADVIHAGAVAVLGVVDASGAGGLEVTEWGLREGVFLAGRREDGYPPVEEVRRSAVEQLAHRFSPDLTHPRQVARLAAELWEALGGAAPERELVWAAGLLHDLGTAVDLDDRHKHSRYIVENAGLPGFSPREVAIVASAARYHRKGSPDLEHPDARKGDDDRLARMAAVLRLAEDLDRARDGAVTSVGVKVKHGTVRLSAAGRDTSPLLERAVRRHGALFRDAFDQELQAWPTD